MPITIAETSTKTMVEVDMSSLTKERKEELFSLVQRVLEPLTARMLKLSFDTREDGVTSLPVEEAALVLTILEKVITKCTEALGRRCELENAFSKDPKLQEMAKEVFEVIENEDEEE